MRKAINKKSDLLPIGAEYEVEYPLHLSDNSCRPSVHRYRVIGHDRCAAAPWSDAWLWCERIDPIECRHRETKGTLLRFAPDAFGRPVFDIIYVNDDGPSPTYHEALAQHRAKRRTGDKS